LIDEGKGTVRLVCEVFDEVELLQKETAILEATTELARVKSALASQTRQGQSLVVDGSLREKKSDRKKSHCLR
jgi:hypothetical protein